MKICAYCGRENEDAATHCRECGIDEFKSNSPVTASEVEDDAPHSDAFQSRLLSVEERQQAFVTLRKCRTVDEANMLAAQLKIAGVAAFLPDESLMSTLNPNAGGFVRLNVPTEQYDQAVEILIDNKRLADAANEPESESAKINRTLPLSWRMRCLMFLLPGGLCPTLLVAAFVCESYRKKGFARRAEEAYLSLLVGLAFWLLIGLIGVIARRS